MRESWISQLGISFLIHRSFSLFVLLLHLILVIKLGEKQEENNPLSLGLIVLLLGTTATGAGDGLVGCACRAATDPFSTGDREPWGCN